MVCLCFVGFMLSSSLLIVFGLSPQMGIVKVVLTTARYCQSSTAADKRIILLDCSIVATKTV
jgi:hypothetical protein